jgi:hypothetical protein
VSFWSEVSPWLVSAIGGALGALALLLPKWGEALIQRKTNKLLEAFKSEQSHELERLKADQSRELERLKEQLNHLGDRGRRSNEMEFVAIEAVWKAFVKAWLSANTCAGAMIQIPDFGRVSEEDVKRLAVSSGFSDRDQVALLRSPDRKEEYVKLVRWQMVIEAQKDIYQARLTLREQRIFMPPEITKQFGDIIERMNAVQVERHIALQHPDAGEMWEVSRAWMMDNVSVFEGMATRANQRLFREERDTAREK